MSLAFVDRLSFTLGIRRRDMVEKDILLHQVLTDLSSDMFFAKNMLFKGGTCLIKHYRGYFRFSEDMDFTWKDQSQFGGKTAGKIRSELSSIIDKKERPSKGSRQRGGLISGVQKVTKNMWSWAAATRPAHSRYGITLRYYC